MEAFIIDGFRSAVGKAPKGSLRFTRPDDLSVSVIEHLLDQYPQLDKELIDDIIVGNATPEAEQGLNIARMIALMGLKTDKVPGMTINRYCSSGLEAIAIAKAKIEAGMADCIIAGGVECMSPIPFSGWKVVPNYEVAKAHPTYYWNMGLTAEAVAKEYKVSRADQDEFAMNSHIKAAAAIEAGHFKEQIVPITVNHTGINAKGKKETNSFIFENDEGVRAVQDPEKIASLRPVFDAKGTVTAASSSQTSDGAAFVILMSEKLMKSLEIKPMARMHAYSVVGVPPRIMGIGPIDAIPKALKQANMSLNQMDQIELNEAFASQSLAIIRNLDLDPSKVNPNGGAIALGHPLGCTGAKLTVQLLHDLKRKEQKYGIVTMCVGTGQGAAGVFEYL